MTPLSGDNIPIVDDALGPAAMWGGTPLVLTTNGIIEIDNGVQKQIWEGNAVDFAVNDAQELVILEPSGLIRVVVNETMYPENTELYALDFHVHRKTSKP